MCRDAYKSREAGSIMDMYCKSQKGCQQQRENQNKEVTLAIAGKSVKVSR
jgi:hypothetical protein